ncbi:hypothetical protein [Streptomyces prunicolor]|jgi:hypothetical protein|uniref:Secreted protein n=1 Tax=Streptomyces prunicolor TaxID=67348 RepID=A0ABU4F4X0_9ACTN|nr:hypothetical protein [Streptomyces prunicolor]MCX5235668.1 hypothetical protein [Streptomyces prunicolor]MDV7215636.1 hypothetical protein [Streptomyces prunicolor]
MRNLSRFASGGAAAIAAGALLFAAAPAHATSSSGTWGIPGHKMQVNAWHCSSYATACDWKASTKVYKGTKHDSAQWVQNRAILTAHGVSVSIKISKNPEASLKMNSKSQGTVRWKNYGGHKWIADTYGQMRPSRLTVYVSTKSCGSAQITSRIKFTEKCVTAGAA